MNVFSPPRTKRTSTISHWMSLDNSLWRWFSGRKVSKITTGDCSWCLKSNTRGVIGSLISNTRSHRVLRVRSPTLLSHLLTSMRAKLRFPLFFWARVLKKSSQMTFPSTKIKTRASATPSIYKQSSTSKRKTLHKKVAVSNFTAFGTTYSCS